MIILRNLKILLFLSVITLSGSSLSAANLQNRGNFELEGKIVDSIVIENRNIYDTDQKEYDKFIFRAANKFHIITQKQIIMREILLQKDKPFSEVLAEETARILRQRFVLYDAWVETEIYETDKLLIRIITIDQWSLSAGVDVRVEGNESRIRIGALEKNLFGQNRLISFYYINQSDDDNYIDASFSDKRLFGKKLMGQLSLSTNPLNKFKRVTLEKPYYNLNQQFGFYVTTKSKKGRIDYYQNEILAAQSTFKGNRIDSKIFYRFGSYDTKYLTKLSYSYNYEKNSSNQVSTDLAQDSLFHAVAVGVEYSKFKFQKLYNIDGFNYTEDFNTGFQVSIEYLRAYSPQSKKIMYNSFSIYARKNIIMNKSLLTLQYLYKDWSQEFVNIRQKNVMNIKYFNRTIDNITLAINAESRSDESIQAFDLISIGGTSGIRGTDKRFLTGDLKLVMNTEIRFLPKYSFLSFNFGGVIFADLANIIHSDNDFMLSNTYTSFGTGLRIAFDKSSKNILRIDFAYSRVNGWYLSFGSGQYFNASDVI